MTKKITITILFIWAIINTSNAQDNNYGVKGFEPKTFTVTDTLPVTYNGLKASYEIKDESERTVGKKGDFSRFKIKFYLTNIGSEAKIMYRNLDFRGHSGPISNNIALFKCLNATGARFTNKNASMELQVCKLEADVEDKDCNTGKVILNKRLVDIGYWIKPGETVSKTYPMIVPLGEKPKVTVTYYAEVANQTGTFIYQNTQQQQTAQTIARLKNAATSTYLNNQTGAMQCSTIDNEWWSAQWEITPIINSNNVLLKNRWKNTYLNNAAADLLSVDAQSINSQWSIQETTTANIFYIKNAADNARLYVENGQIKISANFISNDNNSKWVIEKL